MQLQGQLEDRLATLQQVKKELQELQSRSERRQPACEGQGRSSLAQEQQQQQIVQLQRDLAAAQAEAAHCRAQLSAATMEAAGKACCLCCIPAPC